MQKVIWLVAGLVACAPKEARWIVKDVRERNNQRVIELTDANNPGEAKSLVLYGIDFPPEEIKEPSQKATQTLSALLKDKEITYEVKRSADKITNQGKVVADIGFDACEVRLGPLSINQELVRQGWARAQEYQLDLLKLEEESKQKGLGIWSQETKEQVKSWFAKTEGFEAEGLTPPYKASPEWAQSYPAFRARVFEYFGLRLEDLVEIVDAQGNKVTDWREKK